MRHEGGRVPKGRDKKQLNDYEQIKEAKEGLRTKMLLKTDRSGLTESWELSKYPEFQTTFRQSTDLKIKKWDS